MRTTKTVAILIAHRLCRRVGRQSDTNKLMRFSARSRGVFSGSTWLLSRRGEVWGIARPSARVRLLALHVKDQERFLEAQGEASEPRALGTLRRRVVQTDGSWQRHRRRMHGLRIRNPTRRPLH